MADARTPRNRDARLLRAVRMSVAAAVVVLAAYFPWNGVEWDRLASSLRLKALSSGQSVAHNGWDGAISIGGILFPHWIVVPLAILLAIVAWFEWLLGRNAPLRFSVPIALIGVLYPSCVFYQASHFSFVGVGVPITILAFLYLLWTCVRRPRPREAGACPASRAEEVGEPSRGWSGQGAEAGARAEAKQADDH